MRLIVLFFLLVFAAEGPAQPLSRVYAPTHRAVAIKADYFTKGKSRVYGALLARNYHRIPEAARAVGSLPLNRLSFLGGYEFLLTDYWSIGANWQYSFAESDRIRRLQAYLQHNGTIGKVYFLKRFQIEDLRNRELVYNDRGRIGLGTDLIYPFRFKNAQWQFAFRYTALQDQNWYSTFLPVENRFVDYTLGECSLAVLLKQKYLLSLFAQRETFYYLGLGGFDMEGNPIGERRFNVVTPLVGIGFRVVFHSENAVPWAFPFQ